MSESEIRQNKVTKEWVIFAPARGKKPEEMPGVGREEKIDQLPERDEQCPFCPGSEKETSRIVFETMGKEDLWQTRVIPNKFPALSQDGDRMRRSSGIYLSMGGYGRHEVIVETPLHNQDLGSMSLEDVEAVVETYHRRYRELMGEPEHMLTIIFRNHGPLSGTSVPHPHSQIVSTALVPPYVRRLELEAETHYDQIGRCVYCEILEHERREKTRLVYENSSFAAFVPFAAEVPYEAWIMPLIHQADFSQMTDPEKADFARALQEILGRLRRCLDNPDYNYNIVTPARGRERAPYLHWHLRVKPRLTTPGFQMGSGFPINTSFPEEDAASLRGA